MYVKQSDLLWGLDKSFIQKFIDTAMKETHPQGFTLFKEGESADFFFILVKGGIELSLGNEGRTTYLVNHAGEAFGWSSLVGMEKYSASAVFMKESTVLRFEKGFVHEVTEDDPVNGMEFYKRLARTLGNRLIIGYHHEADTVPRGLESSFGSGQEVASYTAP